MQIRKPSLVWLNLILNEIFTRFVEKAIALLALGWKAGILRTCFSMWSAYAVLQPSA
jgi:hypothetical protein